MTKAIIPNFITAMNLVFGLFAIFSVLDGNFRLAAFFIVAAVVADSLDGRAARALGVSGEFGKEFDSLCDLGSFGVAPAVMAYVFMLKEFGWAGYVTAAFFACCGAYRLARFNVNVSHIKGYFMGLPIPAGGAIVATFIMLQIRLPGWFFPLFVAIVGYLMVSTVKYPDFKGKGGKIKPLPVIVTGALVVAMLVYRPDAWLFAPFLAFMLFGPVNTFLGRMGQ